MEMHRQQSHPNNDIINNHDDNVSHVNVICNEEHMITVTNSSESTQPFT